jgi:hypothetical protein
MSSTACDGESPVRGPWSFTVALAIGTLSGVLAFANPAIAQGDPVEPQANSLQSAIDDFVAYLKSETYDAASEAAKIAREHKDEIDAAKTTLRSRLAELGATLSDQKGRAETLASDALARLEAWSKSGGVSWAEAERLAQDMLDTFTTWLRNQTPSGETEEIPV